MQLSEPVQIKVIHRRDNGSGIVEIPLLPQTEIDLARTEGGGKGRIAVTHAVLEEIARNFASYPGPVPIGVSPHVNFEERGGFAPGFINAVKVQDGRLFGEVDLIAPLFAEVEAGGWRGFSVEIARNLKTATVELQGWALTGGVFTNRPATDVHFRIAAENKIETDGVATINCLFVGEENEMDEKSTASGAAEVTALEAKLATKEQLISTLRATADNMAGEKKALEAQLEETNKDLKAANIALADEKAQHAALADQHAHVTRKLADVEASKRETEVKLEAEQTRALKDQVLEIVHGAIDRGVSAALFEGVEEDPVAWFRSKFTTTDALGKFIEALPTVSQSATSSGRPGTDEKADLSEDVREKFRRMGLDPKYADIKDENELRRRLNK